MVFPYYSRLSARQQATYRASDRIAEIALPQPDALQPLAEALRSALVADDRRAVARAGQTLSRALLDQLHVPALTLKVLAVRPSRASGELHGLYTADGRAPAEIRLWMRTAHHGRVVAFRTFLRTLLHELCHHLDYHLLRLDDSFHTEGFFRRESSLFRQMLPGIPPSRRGRPPRAPGRGGVRSGPDVEGRDTAARQGRIRFDPEAPD